jgi:hypothetical protein
MQHRGKIGLTIFLAAGFFLGTCLMANAQKCVVCGEELTGFQYWATNQITHEAKRVCLKCSFLTNYCTVCGWPAGKDGLKLPDGRILCARCARRVVLDANETKRICAEVRNDLDKLFVRFLVFPANVELAVVDRPGLEELFTNASANFGCTNVPACLQSRTNDDEVEYEISLLSAQPRDELKAVCAHEYAHAWIWENVPAQRRDTLGPDAKEGFCELVAYLLMDSQREEEVKKNILQNGRTHGQLDAFIQAEKRYGFNDILDWMKYGTAVGLEANDLGKIREVEIPRPTPPLAAGFTTGAGRPAPEPDTLVFQGISRVNDQTVALINGKTFTTGESGAVRVGKTNVVICCLSIEKDLVRIQIVASGEVRELPLKPRK